MADRKSGFYWCNFGGWGIYEWSGVKYWFQMGGTELLRTEDFDEIGDRIERKGDE